MPHSTSSEDPPVSDQDAIIAGTDDNVGEHQTIERTMIVDADTNSGNSQLSNTMDQDMDMEDAGVEGEDIPQIKTELKPEVKLEDLFADMDSDEEFPSSADTNLKVEGSPEAPLSSV